MPPPPMSPWKQPFRPSRRRRRPGQVSAPVPHRPGVLPAALGCCAAPSYALLAGRSLVPIPELSLEPSSAAGDLHCVLLSLSAPEQQSRPREGLPEVPAGWSSAEQCVRDRTWHRLGLSNQ